MHKPSQRKRRQTALQRIGEGLLRFALIVFLSLGTLVGIAALALTLSVVIGVLAVMYDWNLFWTMAPIVIALLVLKLWNLYDLTQAPRDLTDAFRRIRRDRDDKTNHVE
ncbi:MAG: hypothetical protein R3F22_01080 [Lysobacteraceae bacterium]